MKKLHKSLLLSILAVLLLATPVLAAYSASILIANTSATGYEMLAGNVSANIDYMANNGVITSTGTDTRVMLGTVKQEHMLATDRITFALPVAAQSTNALTFSTGNSALDNFQIITSRNGYVTVTDNASLELSDNFTIEAEGWITTTFSDNYTNRNFFYKPGAFRAYIASAENITAHIAETITETQAVNDSDQSIYGGGNERTGERIDDFLGNIISAKFKLKKALVPTGTLYCRVWAVSDDSVLGTLGTLDVATLGAGYAQITFNTTPVNVFPVRDIRIGCEYTGGDVNNYVSVAWQSTDVSAWGQRFYANGGITDRPTEDTDFEVEYYDIDNSSLQISATGISSDNHSLRIVYLPNLLTNGNFEDGDPPNNWIINGAGATVSRVSSPVYVDTYSANVTRNGANADLYQGIAYSDYIGREVTIGSWVWASVADRGRIALNDAVVESASAYHTGSSTWEWLTATLTVNPTAAQLLARLQVNTGDTSVYFDGTILVEGDAVPNFNTFRIFIDGVEEGQLYTEVAVPDNSANITLFQNNVMPYVEYFELWKSEIE